MKMPLSGVPLRAVSVSTPPGSDPYLGCTFETSDSLASLWTVLLAAVVANALLSRRRRRLLKMGKANEDAVGSCVFVLFMLFVIGVVCVLPSMLQDP